MTNLRIFSQIVLIASAFAYDIGITYKYKYETTVIVDEDCGEVAIADPVGHILSSDVHLTSIWQNPKDPLQRLIKIEVPKVKLLILKKSSSEERKTKLQEATKHESYFLLKGHRAETFWDDPHENTAIRNLKRSVVSLLQVSGKDGEEKVTDVSGTCDVSYKHEGKTIRRSKRNCRHPLQETTSQPVGVRSMSIQHSAGIDCEMQSTSFDVVSRCSAIEQLKTFSNLWRKSSICVRSTTTFGYSGTIESKVVYRNNDYSSVIEEIKKSKGQLIEGDVFAILTDEEHSVATKVFDSTKSFKESIKTTNLAKLKSVSAFFKLLPSYKEASKEDILKVLRDKTFSKLLPQIMDLLAASSTLNSVEAVLDFFRDERDYNELLERYLISLSVTPAPESFTLEAIKAYLEKGKHHDKIHSTLVTTLGALLRSYASRQVKIDSNIAAEVLQYFEDGLSQCKSDSCVLIYLRGLRNAAQPKSIPILLQFALKGGKQALEALMAIRDMPLQMLMQEHQDLLLRVFHQDGASQDRSSRAIAAEMLLTKASDDVVLRSVLGALSDQSDAEFSTFVTSKVLHLMEENKKQRSRIFRILSEKQVAHYYLLSQKGKSSLFKRQLLDANGLNVTYGIEMELLHGGLLKRSSFDVEFQADEEVSNFLSVGMFAEGLGSFAGVDTSEGDDNASPVAGMELTLLGTSLRPYVFFTSTSELMQHVWSGTASEPTPALQGIFSLSDDHHVVILHNGMATRLDLRGGMSADLSASIQISIWNRNSQSQVKNAAALLFRGSATVDSGVASSRGEFLFYGQSAIDFNSDLEFYEMPFKMCLQMEHPDIELRHHFQKSLEIPETKYSMKKTKKRKRFIPSRSFALHQTNSELCRIMKSSSYY